MREKRRDRIEKEGKPTNNEFVHLVKEERFGAKKKMNGKNRKNDE